MNSIAILASSDRGLETALRLRRDLPEAQVFSTRKGPTPDAYYAAIPSIAEFLSSRFGDFAGLLFVGALGICVRSIAPHLQDKASDPAVVNVDDAGRFAQAVLSGHQGGANDLTARVARILGALPVITTASDTRGLWPLDTLHRRYGWRLDSAGSLNALQSAFLNGRPTALLLAVRDEGALHLERTRPDHVEVFHDYEAIDFSRFEILLAVTPFLHQPPVPALFYRPRVLNLGVGCEKGLDPAAFPVSLDEELGRKGLSLKAVRALGTIDIKAAEPAFLELAREQDLPFTAFPAAEIGEVEDLPNPSEAVHRELGVHGVAEPAAMLLSGDRKLLVAKQVARLPGGKAYTFAVSLAPESRREGLIAIVGAGPGDADLVTVKARDYLTRADLVLYAGSLIPEELTALARSGAVVRDTASMTLEEQFAHMEAAYARGEWVVRLQSGDPCLYGAIQEQMTRFDEKGLRYLIIPGISSFQAAAARLRSEFTIPEVVQTVILTRGRGNTPLPEREKLEELARFRATLCIFLSAHIAAQVQADLLAHYPPETPVAICYRLTWKDEKVWTGRLDELAATMREQKLRRTVLIIVGEAIGARKNRSRLYHPEWNHIFRPAGGRRPAAPPAIAP